MVWKKGFLTTFFLWPILYAYGLSVPPYKDWIDGRCSAWTDGDMKSSQQLQQQTVLIIGVGSILGAHLARYLLHDCEVGKLIGIDNFYTAGSIAMNYKRLQYLVADFFAEEPQSSHNAHLIRREICDGVLPNNVSTVVVLPPLLRRNSDSCTGCQSHPQRRASDCFAHIVEKLTAHPKTQRLLYVTYPSEEQVSQERRTLAEQLTQRTGILTVELVINATLYGPWEDPLSSGGMISYLTSSLLRGEQLQIRKDQIDRSVSYMHVFDAVKSIAAAVTKKFESSPRTLHFSSTFTASTLQLVCLLEKRLEKKFIFPPKTQMDLLTVAAAKRGTICGSLNFDFAAMRGVGQDTLLIPAAYDWNRGLTSFLDWYRAHRASHFPCASECHFDRLCFASSWDRPAAVARALSDGCSSVIYTVATGAAVNALHPILDYEGIDHYERGHSVEQHRCYIAFVSYSAAILQNLNVETIASSNNTISSDSSGVGDSNRSGGTADSGEHNFISITEANDSRNGGEFYEFGNWTLIPVAAFGEPFTDTRKPTRVPKISPRHFFAKSVQYAVYIDSKLQLSESFDPEYFLKLMSGKYHLNLK